MTAGTAAVLSWAARSETDRVHPTDRELIRRFADAGEEVAFAVLVARHSRMVFGVCRRLLPTIQDAEDACQATFLILARQARGGRWHSSVANWLYTTARRVAANARRTAARRARREGRAAVSEAVRPLDEIPGRELLAALDEELGRLSPLYREPLVLCYLEGLSREASAARLGIPASTVKIRLERGRERLAAALTRRGLGLAAGLLVLAVTGPAGAASAQLADRIRAVVSGPPPAAVAALARGALMTTAFRRVVVLVATVISAAGLGVGWSGGGQAYVPDHGPVRTPMATVVAPVPAPVFAVAPVPKEADEPFHKEVAAARDKAVRFLKGLQKPDGTWEGVDPDGLTGMEGGATALVVVALLEAGVPAADPAVAKAVRYLADVPPTKTYVVSLQTQALAKAGAGKQMARIQKNVDWLLDGASGFKKTGQLEGWTYVGGAAGADGSNTHFAVIALHSAKMAGAKVDEKVWGAIRDLYVRTQQDDGWAYTNRVGVPAPTTGSMTTAGLIGLAVAARHAETPAAARDAFTRGMRRLVNTPATDDAPLPGYQWLLTAELGRTTGKLAFQSEDKTLAWYREGATKLVKEQQPDGSWSPGKYNPKAWWNTAFGLYFLGPPLPR